MPSKEAVLLRFRERDSGAGVTRTTVASLARELGLSETETIHRALAEYARAHLPQYEADEGYPSPVALRAVARAVRAEHGPARVVESLFARPAGARKPRRAVKSVRPSSRSR